MTPLIVLTGPTGVGKTRLSVRLAKEIGAEIISADSMQVYRHMDIGTAKITRDEMQGVAHHLIDILEPTAPFDITLFQRLAKAAIEEITQRGHLPILVGGTGFYIRAVCYDTDFTQTSSDRDIRTAYENLVREKGEAGVDALYEKLRLVDPKAAFAIPKNNVKRVIRALEYHDRTGQKISVHNEKERAKPSPYDLTYLVIGDTRERLYKKINERVDDMMEAGFLEEVRALMQLGVTRQMTSMQALGYRELYAHLLGECTLEEAVAKIKQNTRHFCKRQLTWFRAEKDAVWIEKNEAADEDALYAAVLDHVKGVRR